MTPDPSVREAEELKGMIRANRVDGKDPFFEYQEGRMSKGALLESLVPTLAEALASTRQAAEEGQRIADAKIAEDAKGCQGASESGCHKWIASAIRATGGGQMRLLASQHERSIELALRNKVLKTALKWKKVFDFTIDAKPGMDYESRRIDLEATTSDALFHAVDAYDSFCRGEGGA